MTEDNVHEVDLSKVNKKEKARYWNFVMYPESMIENWQEDIAEIIQYPYAYCIHDKCMTKDGLPRKIHVHIIIAFPNTTTYNNVLAIAKKLGVCNYVEKTQNIRWMYNYLIHDTEDARKKGKYQYDPNERITGNDFDIGSFEQLSSAEKDKILLDIKSMLRSGKFQDFYELDEYIDTVIQDSAYSEVFRTYQSFLYNLMKAKFVHDSRIKAEKQAQQKAKLKTEIEKLEKNEGLQEK